MVVAPIVERTQRIDTRTRADQVRDRMVDMIRVGGLRPGEKLPTEPQLMEMFGVGRTTVRGATQALAGLGILELRPGHGAYVRQLSVDRVVQMVGSAMNLERRAALQLHEARSMVEIAATRLAAERRSADDLEPMRRAIARYAHADAVDDLRAVTDADIDFHAALVRAAHNDVLVTMLQSVAGLLWDDRRRAQRHGDDRRTVVEDHVAILEAVVAGDDAAAVREIERHLARVGRKIEAGMGRDDQSGRGA